MKTAVVLGGSAGIGLGCARALKNSGHRVVLFSRDSKKLEKARKSLKSDRVFSFLGDMGSAPYFLATLTQIPTRS